MVLYCTSGDYILFELFDLDCLNNRLTIEKVCNNHILESNFEGILAISVLQDRCVMGQVLFAIVDQKSELQVPTAQCFFPADKDYEGDVLSFAQSLHQQCRQGCLIQTRKTVCVSSLTRWIFFFK